MSPPSPETSPSAVPPARAITVVIPAFNEEAAVRREVEGVDAVMKRTGWAYELIVVDDGSTDRTAEEVPRELARLIRLPRNRGYGAALRAGIDAARTEWILITDADGTYPPEAIPTLLDRAPDHDMVVGARTGARVHVPLVRRVVKWFLAGLASYLAAEPIPDLNSGLRVVRTRRIEEFQHLLPAGFSFTTTLTLALLCNGYSVFYEPIEYHRRVGASKFRPADASRFLVQILRTMVFFNPLRVFLPLGALLFLAGCAKLVYDIFLWNLSESAVMGILGGIIVWAVGLLADQIAVAARAAKPR